MEIVDATGVVNPCFGVQDGTDMGEPKGGYESGDASHEKRVGWLGNDVSRCPYRLNNNFTTPPAKVAFRTISTSSLPK